MSVEVHKLDNIDLFNGLKSDDMETLAANFHAVKVTEGEVIVKRGNPAETFYIILSGNFMVYFKDGRAFTLHQKGEFIGVSTMLTPFQYQGTAVALTDGELLAISGDQLIDIVQGDSVLGNLLMKKINKVVIERRPYADGSLA